ncbi:MAG: CBS domain-containing protein [Deltaproteobacteria bacterium]|nr:CBS domain-containing protein [Deltaproteobacteria bacterium]
MEKKIAKKCALLVNLQVWPFIAQSLLLTTTINDQDEVNMETAKDMLRGKIKDLVTVPAGTTLFKTLEMMNQHRVGAILVTRDKQVVGIWTERDLMRNTIVEDFDPKTALIDDYMTSDLVSAPHTDTVFNLMDKFLGRRIRHLLIEEEGQYIGLISGGDVMKCVIHAKDAELRQLNSMVSWDYYENWKWKP